MLPTPARAFRLFLRESYYGLQGWIKGGGGNGDSSAHDLPSNLMGLLWPHGHCMVNRKCQTYSEAG